MRLSNSATASMGTSTALMYGCDGASMAFRNRIAAFIPRSSFCSLVIGDGVDDEEVSVLVIDDELRLDGVEVTRRADVDGVLLRLVIEPHHIGEKAHLFRMIHLRMH